MATCSICRAQITTESDNCWRCRGHNEYWGTLSKRTKRKHLRQFFVSAGGVIALLAIVIPVLALVLVVLYAVVQASSAPAAQGIGQHLQTWGASVASHLNEQKTGILAQALAAFLSLMAVTFIYAVRIQLWHYSWIRHIRWKKSPALNVAAMLLLVAGVVLLLAYLTILLFYKPGAPTPVMSAVPSATLSPTATPVLTVTAGLTTTSAAVVTAEPPPMTLATASAAEVTAEAQAASGHFDFSRFFDKIIIPTLYSLVALCFAIGGGLMAASSYIADLNTHVDQPIYMNTDLLAFVVQEEVKGNLDPVYESARKTGAALSSVVLRVVNIERTPTGGIRMILDALKKPIQVFSTSGTQAADTQTAAGQPSPTDSTTAVAQNQSAVDANKRPTDIETSYEVEANEWGQIQAMRELRQGQSATNPGTSRPFTLGKSA